MSDTTDWVDHWKAGAEAGDACIAAAALADDVVLLSPLTEQFTFRGRNQIEDLLVSVFEVFTDIRFTDDLRSDGQAALFARGSVGTETLHEVQHLWLDQHGRIRELVLAMRPLPAVTAFVRALGPKVARRQGRPAAARLLTVAGAVLDGVTRSGDRRFIPLVRPERTRRE